MNGSSFKDIEKLEADLWSAADNLRANAQLTSSDYFMPVLGIIFLRHAANRIPKIGIQTGPFGCQLHQSDYSEEGIPVVMPKCDQIILEGTPERPGPAFTPKGVVRWLNTVRTSGHPVVAEADIMTALRCADSLDVGFRERVEWWGDRIVRP